MSPSGHAERPAGRFRISARLGIPMTEIELTAIQSRGPGGQNVNKLATAVQLRLDIAASSLPATAKEKLLAWPDRRISSNGTIIIRAQRHRSQGRNRDDALARLRKLILAALATPKPRRATRPTRASRERRLEDKRQRGTKKALRRPVRDY